MSEPSPRIEVAPLNVMAMTPPVEATLRILLNSVPYLIGAAVVRHPAVGDAVQAEVGRMPWLHDRRLLNLQLPDDTLPANRAIVLDWPVPYQAEWVGAPPRLLISRLVGGQEKTVGVLLGTLLTRDQLTPQAREALDLSCELIAAAVGSDSLATFAAMAPSPAQSRRLVVVPDEPEPEPEPQPLAVVPESAPELDPKDEQDERDRLVVEEVGRALDDLTDARSIGRVLRDAVTAIAGVDGFSLSLFNSVRREVAYRYKVVGGDPEAVEMGRQAVDDGPDCYAARHDRRWHALVREIGVRGPEGVEARKISVLQYPLVSADETFGVATLQVFGDTGYSDHATRLVARVLEVSSDRLPAGRRGSLLLRDAARASDDRRDPQRLHHALRGDRSPHVVPGRRRSGGGSAPRRAHLGIIGRSRARLRARDQRRALHHRARGSLQRDRGSMPRGAPRHRHDPRRDRHPASRRRRRRDARAARAGRPHDDPADRGVGRRGRRARGGPDGRRTRFQHGGEGPRSGERDRIATHRGLAEQALA